MQSLLVLLILLQPPHETDPVKIVSSTGIKLYKTLISPSQGDVCNFSPSCSHFTRQAIEKYGIIWGSLMASDRLMRCNPWAYQYFDEYYTEIRDHKFYDPPENNYILRAREHHCDGEELLPGN
ncbi:MAG: membrane protein insertion efficiency factor YidD [candidate division WOR-3 bacterium]|nr:MAG: membrane protein insertion efficiency factor YidD [candidate division WOR-3 bacterium]